MKNSMFTGGLLLVLLTAFFSCNQKNEEVKINNEQIKAEIQAIEDHFAMTYNNRNADSITYYADNAVSYFSGEEPIVGKEAIHQHIESELMDFPEGATLSFETIEIYVTDDGNNVAEIGAHKLVDSSGVILQKGHYVSFFAKRDGKFVCTRDMANTVQVGN